MRDNFRTGHHIGYLALKLSVQLSENLKIWLIEWVDWVNHNGLMLGVGDWSFSPHRPPLAAGL